MATQTETKPTAAIPELTVLTRVGSIPFVASSLDTIHSTLSTNAYTRTPYATATGISKAAYGWTEPIQKTLAPVLVRADGLANKGLDIVESRYPYPFKTPTEDIVKDIKGCGDSAKGFASKTIDEKVKTPVYSAAQGIDQRFAPVVDYFAAAVKQVHSTTGSPEPVASSSEPPKFQYQRAYALSKDLTDQLYTFSTEQINTIKTQNVYVHRASEAAQRVSAVASSSYGAAQEKVHAVSDAMLQELQRVQQSTAALPAQLQSTFHDISAQLAASISDISAILTSTDPINEKVHKVADTVHQTVNPLLDATSARVQEILDVIRGKATEVEQEVRVPNGNGVVNGNGTANGHA